MSGIKQLFIKLKNIRVHYKISGNGDPIILLHGWGGSIGYFAKLQEYLAHRFTVYVVDLPGFGLSTVPEEFWGSAEYADLMAQFIREVNISNPILLGHSFGGKIAINLVARGLVKAKKLVLVGSSGIKLPKSLKVNFRIYFFKALRILSLMPIIKSILESSLERYRKKFGSDDYKNASGIMRTILVKTVNENVMMLLPKINIPTLLLWGDQDTAAPLQGGKIMQQAIDGSKLKIIVGGGHFSFLDNWEKFIEELDGFL